MIQCLRFGYLYHEFHIGRLWGSYQIIVLLNGTVKQPVVITPKRTINHTAKTLQIDIEIDGYYVGSKKVGDKNEMIKKAQFRF